MGILVDMEKDKIWTHMNDMRILGMTREDLDNDDGIMEDLEKLENLEEEK